MKPTLRLAYILTAFPTVSETFVEGEFRALMARGLPIDLYATRNYRESPDPEADRGDRGLQITRSSYFFSGQVLVAAAYFLWHHPWRVLRIFALTMAGNLPSPRYLLHALALFPKCLVFARAMRRKNTGQVHATWGHYPATVAFVISQILDIPFSFSAHASLDVSRDITFQAEKVRSAEFVLTCNAASREAIAGRNKDHSDKIRLVYHGVSLQSMPAPGSEEKHQPPEIISVGRLRGEKGFLELLEACHLVHQRGIEFRLRIFGQGPQRAELENFIVANGLQEQIRLEGVAPHATVLKSFATARVVTLASHKGPAGQLDGIPNVLVEALACGTPVVTTSHPGSHELLEDGRYGLIVPQKDVAELAKALESVLRDPEPFLKQASEGRSKVQAIFDREKNVEAIASLFKQTLEAQER